MKNYSNDQVEQITKNGISYLTFRALAPYQSELRHAIFLRQGGVSLPPLNSLNFRLEGTDDSKHVIENLKRACQVAGFSKEVYKGIQAHTNRILLIDHRNKEKYQFELRDKEVYDGYITSKKNITTMITTADCNPIIIYDPIHHTVANIHSGWKGTLQKIYLIALEEMSKNFKTEAKDVIVCIGPSIGKCCFSSEEEAFKEKFVQIWKEEEKYIFYEENKKRFHIDLSYVIYQDLIQAGVMEKNISFSGICTRCNHEDFFSYRYATQKNQKDYGLMATLVELI